MKKVSKTKKKTKYAPAKKLACGTKAERTKAAKLMNKRKKRKKK